MIPYVPNLLELVILWAGFVWLVLCVVLGALFAAVLIVEAFRPRRHGDVWWLA